MPKITTLTDEMLIIDPEMIDDDNMMSGVEAQFKANSSLEEGVSGRKAIDTMYENTSQDYIDNPREGSTPAPTCGNDGMFPHRRM